MDGGAWKAAVHGAAKSRTRLSDFTFTFHFHALEKEMATHSSVLAWRIPGTGEPGGLLSMGSHRVGHDWSDLAAAGSIMHCNINIPLLHLEYYSTQLIYLLGWRTDYFSKHLKGKDLKNIEAGTFLVVQWLRHHAPNAGIPWSGN